MSKFEITLDVGSTKNREGRIAYLPSAALEALRAWDEETKIPERDRGVIVSEGVIMQIAGWKTRSVFERYNIKNEKDLQEAAAKVGSVREMGPGNGAKASVTPISTK